MKNVSLILFLWAFPLVLFATADDGRVQGSVKSYDDYVMIRFMPSRGDFHRREPVTELKSIAATTIVIADGTVMKTNETMKEIYEQAKALHEKGVTTNQRHFHMSTKKVEVSYKGEKISLEYVGPSQEEEFRLYETEWLALYDKVYAYLTKDIK